MSHSRRLCVALSLAALAGAAAAQRSYLNLSGIPGTVPTGTYAQWSEVQDVSFSVDAALVDVRGGSGRVLGKPVISAIGWSQPVDTTMPPLLDRLIRGESSREVIFEWVTPGPAGDASVARLRLTDAQVTGLALNNGAYSAQMQPNRLGMGFKPLLPDGLLGKQRNVGYDLREASYSESITGALLGESPRKGVKPPPPPQPTGERIFMRHDAANEAGASRFVGYENWSEVFGASWSAGVVVGDIGGGGGGGKPFAGEFKWTQALDNAAFDGLHDILDGELNDQLVFEFVRNAGGGPVTYMQVVLSDAYFTHWSLDGQIAQSVNFTKIVQTVWAIDANGKRGKAVTVGWDLAKAGAIKGAMPVDPLAGFGAGGLSGAVVAVPEPQTALLLAAGLLLVLRRQRRSMPSA
jgi:type VI protein secretion system component Hcp